MLARAGGYGDRRHRPGKLRALADGGEGAKAGGSSTAADDLTAAREGTELLTAWLRTLGAPTRLPWDEGCPDADMDIIVGDVLGRQMAKDNPRESTAEDLRDIVAKSIAGWQ